MHAITTGHRDVNGARLYYELRGRGPAVLFISGATGDAGHYTTIADELASELAVVTYDRRGNSRSPRPRGWTRTTIEEQADDAACLASALGFSLVVAVGVGSGALIARCLARRHADRVRGAIVYDRVAVDVAALPADTRARISGNDETLRDIELPAFRLYRDDAEPPVPLRVLGETITPATLRPVLREVIGC
jgi:pimeloyl-ACP methyl ester carboxylesterase